MLGFPTPDLRLFWTAYDPLDLASGSIDVLGLQSGYIALGEQAPTRLHHGDYLAAVVSMLCAAVGAAEAAFPGTGEPGVRLRQTRLAAVKSYERAWALACGLAAADTEIGDKAADGLRGVQYVRRRLSELGREKSIRTSSFNLLANQVRYGGIGAYSTLLEDCHLASMRSVAVLPDRGSIRRVVPPARRRLAVWDEDRPLLSTASGEWGLKCHLGEFTREEGRCLAAASGVAKREGGRTTSAGRRSGCWPPSEMTTATRRACSATCSKPSVVGISSG